MNETPVVLLEIELRMYDCISLYKERLLSAALCANKAIIEVVKDDY